MKLNKYDVMIDNVMHVVVKVQDIKVVLREMARNVNTNHDGYAEALDDLYNKLK